MLTLKCTKKVQDYLGLKGGDLTGATEPSSVLGAWYVNQFSVGRRKAFIFMSERTYLSFIMLDVKKSNSDVEMLPLMCIRGIVQTLELHKASHDLIERVVEDCQSVSYSRTDSAKVLGNLNDLVARYKWLIEERGGMQYADVGGYHHQHELDATTEPCMEQFRQGHVRVAFCSCNITIRCRRDGKLAPQK